jgi:predicted anti-sigma-YlaC factor YlaD
VTRSCDDIQPLLTESAGEVIGLPEWVRDHLRGCDACRRAADEEASLHRLLAESVPPEDVDLELAIRHEIARRRGRRRLLAFLPVAASLAIGLLGVMLFGGVPGGGLLAMLPTWSQQGWLALGQTASDWTVATGTVLKAAAGSMPPAVTAIAGLLGLAAVAGAVGLSLRWRAITPWRRDD